jgi:uncharacterized protein HemY
MQSKTEIKTEQKIKLQNITENMSLQQKIDDLKKSMLEYMKTSQPSYSKSDVDKCIGILENYIAEISKTKSKEEAMNIVKSTVIQLNDLNNNAKSELIETMERDQIANIIISATYQKGYNSMEEDITEQWREW